MINKSLSTQFSGLFVTCQAYWQDIFGAVKLGT